MKPLSPEGLLKHLGRRVAEVRAERGLTQEQLAAETGQATRYIQAVEAGRQNVTVATIAKLANGLRVHPEEFFRASRRAPR